MNIYILLFLLLFQNPFASPTRDIQPGTPKSKAATVTIVFKSADGGQTWQDISEGLPENWQAADIERDGFFANDSGLYVRAGIRIYRSKPAATGPYWQNEIFVYNQGRIAGGKTCLYAYDYEGQFLQKMNGTSAWSPIFLNFQQKRVRAVFQTSGGTVFIASDNGLFRSANDGKTWKHVPTAGGVMKLVESNGVLLATGRGIFRSTDDGETWDRVIYEGGVGIDVVNINGGFAAITYSTTTRTRRLRTSYDGGKTWQPIDAGLNGDPRTASIIEVDGSLFCGHPDGIYKSSNKGKTWKLLLPSIRDQVFNLFVSGNVIYAIPMSGGC
jgi:photosystem II stability/assembly factor-like uncharacterized protein